MRKKILVIILTALVLISGTVLGLSAVYRVKDVTVNVTFVSETARGEAEKMQKDLQAAYHKRSTFFVKEEKALEVLKDYPYFRLTAFEKSYPKRVVINVTENDELYAVEKTPGEVYYLLGADGAVLDIRNTPNGDLDDTPNVLLKGLTVDGSLGEIPAGDDCFAVMLEMCNQVSKSLEGIRRNVVSVEVVRRNPEIIFCMTMKEGVKIYVNAPQEMLSQKLANAINKYMFLPTEQKMTGSIVVWENAGQILVSYSPIDNFSK